jgi:hypothetical protein
VDTTVSISFVLFYECREQSLHRTGEIAYEETELPI